MDFNIQIQIAALIFTLAVLGLYIVKPKIHNLQNKIFLYQLLLSIFLISVDIVSCVFIAQKDIYPAWNDLFGKGYIIIMLFWISFTMEYLFATIRHDKMRPAMIKFQKVIQCVILVMAGIFTIVTMCLEVFYFHEGRVVYSYGIPSTCTYCFSAFCLVILVTMVIVNWKYLTRRKRIPCLVFAATSSIPALIQVIFPEYLVLGLGCGLTELIMYMALENPDLEYANRIEVLNQEKKELFRNVMPDFISEKMNYTLSSYYEEMENVCVGYVRIKNFNEMAGAKGLPFVVDILNKIYQAIDGILDNYGIEKIKISGDTYEVATGLRGHHDTDCQNMISFINSVRTIVSGISLGNEVTIKAAFGVDCGPVAVCMMGSKRIALDLLSSTAELAFLVTEECESDNVLVTESVKEKTQEVFEYQRPVSKQISDFGTKSLYYLKLN